MKDNDELQTIFIYIADHNWPKYINYYAPYYQTNQGTMVIIGIKYDFLPMYFCKRNQCKII